MAEKRHLSKKEKKLRTAAVVLLAAYVIFLLFETSRIIDFMTAEIIITAIFTVGIIIISILIKDGTTKLILLVSSVMGFFYLINLIIMK